ETLNTINNWKEIKSGEEVRMKAYKNHWSYWANHNMAVIHVELSKREIADLNKSRELLKKAVQHFEKALEALHQLLLLQPSKHELSKGDQKRIMGMGEWDEDEPEDDEVQRQEITVLIELAKIHEEMNEWQVALDYLTVADAVQS
ncbi:hypothetical protein RFI_33441, partial [Reticulomyxa filosa]